VNLLRLGFLLVLVGLFAPIGCDLNGYQVAQGILGNTKQLGNATLIADVPDIFGYALFGVFALALAGLILTFFTGVKKRLLPGFLCLASSLVLLVVVALKLEAMRQEPLRHFLVALFGIKVYFMIGGFSMAAGYLAGILAFILKTVRRRDQA
jgi:hypothetical protein